jgi:hypothetical protein
MPAIDVFWLNHSMAFLPDRGASLAWSAGFYGYAQLRRIAGTFAQGHDRSTFFTARMRSRAIHPASEAASGVEYDSPVLSAQLGSSIRVIT